MIVCGVMTGTSCDGIDIAICDFKLHPDRFSYHQLYFEHFKFSNELQYQLKKLIDEQIIDLKTLSQLNIAYTIEIAEVISKAISNANLDNVDLIGLHGQTLWHNPTEEIFLGKSVSSTFQLGSGTFLAARLKTKVVYDFRTADIAFGGQGAPLVPVFDYYFLKSNEENIIALNIGGISNLTFVPAKCNKDQIIAFDCGPGNSLIDAASKNLFNCDFDNYGNLASQGSVVEEIMNELIQIEFIHQKPPKSTGKELFNEKLILKYFSKYDKFDILRTLTEFTAYAISTNIKLYTDEKAKIVVSGGGAYNPFLIQRLKEMLPKSKIISSLQVEILPQAKEAIAFAFLAFCRVNSINGNIPAATGAIAEVLLGSIAEV